VILILFTGKSAGVGAWALWMTEDGVELNFCDGDRRVGIVYIIEDVV
jgi:hypothetical protein